MAATVAPFMNQIRRWPVLVFCQRMSGFPSPLKSPVPAICQSVETMPRFAVPLWVAPFAPVINQTFRWPVTVFCQTRSGFPSPLKSPTPAICHSVGKTPMGASKSIGILSYSPEEKVYTYYGVDNSNMTMSTVPRGTVQGDTWTYTDESMMGGKKVKSRVTIKELSPSAYTFALEVQGPDGKWAPMMESKNTKMK